MLPETLSERALAAHESHPNKRLITHFMQPHVPFIGETRPEIRSEMMGGFREMMLGDPDEFDIGSSSWEAVSTGAIEKEIFWEAYRDNLIRALEEAVRSPSSSPGNP